MPETQFDEDPDRSEQVSRHRLAFGALVTVGLVVLIAQGSSLPVTAGPDTLQQHYAFSTYLGGSGADSAQAVAVDQSGNIVLAGTTTSTDFPLVDPIQSTLNGDKRDAFVVVLTPDGQRILFSTYLGGSDHDHLMDAVLDSDGHLVLAGYTESTDFPTLNASQPDAAGERDWFVTRIDLRTRQILFSTYLGTGGLDSLEAVAALDAGGVVVLGTVEGDDYPLDHRFPPGAGADAPHERQGILAQFQWRDDSVDLTTSNLPGSTLTLGHDVDVHGSRITVVGRTTAENLPTDDSAFSRTRPGDQQENGFVCSLSALDHPNATCTYLGAASKHQGVAVGDERVYVAGHTLSPDFPVVNPIQPFPLDGFGRCCVLAGTFVQLDSALTSMHSGTFFGGSYIDEANTAAFDSVGNAYIGGTTRSSDIPLVEPLHRKSSPHDGFLASFTPDGRLRFSTYLLGRMGRDVPGGPGGAIAVVEPDRLVYVSSSGDADYPLVNPIQPRIAGVTDAVVSIIDLRDVPTPGPATPMPTRVPGTETPAPDPGAIACPQLSGRAPAAAITAALANPDRVGGWDLLCYPNRPPGRWNGLRQSLSLRDLGKPYHPLFNPLVFKCGCG